MDAAIYFPLYLVLANRDLKLFSIYYLAADLQEPELFKERKLLTVTAKRAGWKGSNYDIRVAQDKFVRLV